MSYHYEIVMLGNLSMQDEFDSLVTEIRRVVQEQGGVIDREENWGRFALAYKIGKHTQANFRVFNITCQSSQKIQQIREILRLSTTMLRYLVSKHTRVCSEPTAYMRRHAPCKRAAQETEGTSSE